MCMVFQELKPLLTSSNLATFHVKLVVERLTTKDNYFYLYFFETV